MNDARGGNSPLSLQDKLDRISHDRDVLAQLRDLARRGLHDGDTVCHRESGACGRVLVLRAEPVYQTLRATRTEQRCDEVPAAMPEAPQPEQDESRWSRMVDSVRGWFGADAEPERAPPVTLPAVKVNCRVVPIEREFQRPIAYDVDYIYKGVKYRSRLAEDPGNRLRIRISVVPYVAPAQATASGP